MKKLLIIFMFLLLIGCESNALLPNTVQVKGNPTAETVLKENPTANIFMYSDLIYTAGVEWVDELELTKDQLITEIAEQKSAGHLFKNGTANKLPLGTKIYSVGERRDVLIAETEEGDLRFYMLVEG